MISKRMGFGDRVDVQDLYRKVADAVAVIDGRS
jgi:hypothetical protein